MLPIYKILKIHPASNNPTYTHKYISTYIFVHNKTHTVNKCVGIKWEINKNQCLQCFRNAQRYTTSWLVQLIKCAKILRK